MKVKRECRACAGIYYSSLPGRRYCCHACAVVGQTRVTLEMLREVAKRGTKLYVAEQLYSLHQVTVRRALRRHGLYRQWQMNRYKKCRAVEAPMRRAVV